MATKKPRASKKKAEPGSKGFSPADCKEAPSEAKALGETIESARGENTEDHCDQRSGHAWRDPLQHKDEGKGAEPHRRRGPAHVAYVSRELPEPLEEATRNAGKAEQRRQLTDDDGEGEADDVPRQLGAG